MARTKLIVEITTRDEKTQKYECVDFPDVGPDFIRLYLPNFTSEMIRTETVLGMRRYFTHV